MRLASTRFGHGCHGSQFHDELESFGSGASIPLGRISSTVRPSWRILIEGQPVGRIGLSRFQG